MHLDQANLNRAKELANQFLEAYKIIDENWQEALETGTLDWALERGQRLASLISNVQAKP